MGALPQGSTLREIQGQEQYSNGNDLQHGSLGCGYP